MASALSSVILVAAMLVLCCFSGQTRGGVGGPEVVTPRSLMPAAVCSSPEAPVKNSLTVVHRHGPCSSSAASTTDYLETLQQDKQRVASLQERVLSAGGGSSLPAGLTKLQKYSKVSLPARRGFQLGSGNYVLQLGLGTPRRNQTVVLDTGSDVCWVQCMPCVGSCYEQQDPIFDPSASSSYRNISCNSATCTKLPDKGCTRGGTCVYGVLYGDNSTTAGFLARETLRLTPADVFPSFVFGCGQENDGLFGSVAGLVGLGRSPFSLVSQTAARYGNVFSYCLPWASMTGHLSLGKSSLPRSARYTPMLTDRRAPSLYFIDLIGISVGGRRLPIRLKVFRNVGTILDSGTVITRLPPSAYASLRRAFRRAMSRYTLAQPAGFLDTCYDFTDKPKVTYPSVVLHYAGLDVTLPALGVFVSIDVSQVCLAFAGNAYPGEMGIIGNVQQQTFEVIYDIGAKRIGFAAGAC